MLSDDCEDPPSVDVGAEVGAAVRNDELSLKLVDVPEAEESADEEPVAPAVAVARVSGEDPVSDAPTCPLLRSVVACVTVGPSD